MKKMTIFTLILLLSLLLAACGGEESSSSSTNDSEATGGETAVTSEDEASTEETAVPAVEPIELSMTVWGSQADEEVYRQRLDLFHAANPNITVELIYIPSDYDQKVQTMIAGGTAPDIIQLAEAVHAYSSKGQIISLNEYTENSGINIEERFGSALPDLYSWDGQLYAMPDRGGAMVIYYNKDAFDAAGVAYPTQDWTWDDMLSAAQALTIRDGDEVTQYGFAAGGWWPWWMSFIYQNGGRILDENGQPVVNTPEVIEALEFYNDLVYEYGVAPSPEDYANLGFTSPDPLFAQGKVAFQATGMWNIGSLKDAPELNWDIAPMWQNAEPGTAMFGSGLAISKDCPDYDACFKVVDFLTSVAGQTPIATAAQDAPANLEVLRSDAFLNAGWSDKEINLLAFEESAEAVFTPPVVAEWNEIQTIFDNNLSEVWLNQKEVSVAVEQIQAELEALLNE